MSWRLCSPGSPRSLRECGSQIVGGADRPFPERVGDFLSLFGGPRGGSGDDVGTGRVEPEPEGRDDPEVGSRPPQSPEQLRVLIVRGSDSPALGGDGLDIAEVVGCQARPT